MNLKCFHMCIIFSIFHVLHWRVNKKTTCDINGMINSIVYNTTNVVVYVPVSGGNKVLKTKTELKFLLPPPPIR
jgi:hypothetical protein